METQVEWNTDIETFVKGIGEKSYSYSILHKNTSSLLQRMSIFIDIPIVIVSVVNGFLSIGSRSVFGSDSQSAPLITGTISLISSLLSTLSLYFGFIKKSENHRLSGIAYSKLFNVIATELSLPRTHRKKPYDFLKMIEENYERLQETSLVIPDKIINYFSEKYAGYKDKIIMPPELNGLMEITIHKQQSVQLINKIETP